MFCRDIYNERGAAPGIPSAVATLVCAGNPFLAVLDTCLSATLELTLKKIAADSPSRRGRHNKKQNLSQEITFANGDKIEYFYQADGVKVQKVVTQGSTVTTTDYVEGGIQFTNNVFDFVPTAEGYVKNTVVNGTNTYSYVYNYTDHLGNVRLSYAKSPGNVLTILEENNYYPFGMKHSGYNNDGYVFGSVSNALALVFNGAKSYQYKFQGQERQDELGLGWDSFKWRNYDYAIGRFMNIDPLTEKYTDWGPYVFSGNRVVDARELEGLEPYLPYKTQEEAAQNFIQNYNGVSITENLEYVTKTYTTTDANGNTTYTYAEPVQGTPAGANPNKVKLPQGATMDAIAHTHGAYDVRYDNDNFSGVAGDAKSMGDMGTAERNNVNVYVGTPDGSAKKYDVTTDTVSVLSTSMPSDPKHPARLNSRDAVAPIEKLKGKPIEFKPEVSEIKLPPIVTP